MMTREASRLQSGNGAWADDVKILMLLSSANVAGVTIVEVAGRVVDQEEKPVAGVRVVEDWFAGQATPLELHRAARIDAEGRFSLEVKPYGRGTVVMARDSAGGLGGQAVIPAEGSGGPIQINSASSTTSARPRRRSTRRTAT